MSTMKLKTSAAFPYGLTQLSKVRAFCLPGTAALTLVGLYGRAWGQLGLGKV